MKFNSYNLCIYKLLGLKLIIDEKKNDFRNDLNNLLERYGLSNFQHRLILRMLVFTQKLLKARENSSGPKLLTNLLKKNSELNKGYMLRNLQEIATQQISDLNNYGEDTFHFVYCRIASEFCVHETEIDINFYKLRVKNNINTIFTKFIEHWPKFDLSYNLYLKKPQTTEISNSFILTESSVS